ncbi:hypothetical protein [Massilia cavernae]|uniref:Secreted protein n=1 Tax=Massilia cavernae TaxID=2320864 RepID=A0A418XE49_9BURK|nr:hypothetical protein [Massilia cavernae]RJG10775.1 hypothetical protein D3872_21435 [Massilia cavernae]
MKILPNIVLATVLAGACAMLAAAPAPWFQWRSKIDGALVCSQTPLGKGWTQAAGPFRDSHCVKLMSGK